MKHLDRRQFLQGSMALLGGGSTQLGRAHAGEAGGQELRLQLASASAQRIWILVSPEAGFQERLASKELARGLRNLGLAREPIHAVTSAPEPGSQGLVFTLLVNKEGLKHPEAYEIATERATGESSRVRVSKKSQSNEVNFQTLMLSPPC